jgi:Flp pilus assembly protein TadD
MNIRRVAVVSTAVLVVGGGGVLVVNKGAWRHDENAPELPSAELTSPDRPAPDRSTASSPDQTPDPQAAGDLQATPDPQATPDLQATGDLEATGDLPVPPFPPRIAEGDQYEKCMTMIANDPQGAEAIAASWQATGGGDAAMHCQALASIASGQPEAGAKLLESLAHGGRVQGLARMVLLGQAAEARLMVDENAPALQDATEALAISPDDPDLLITRADANDALGRANDAVDDLTHALQLDPTRGDALVLRASVRRRMDRPDDARADIAAALALDPEDAEALVERGILRQETGDLAGAREDWAHAQKADPNSEAAELAAQNLALLDAGPAQK